MWKKMIAGINTLCWNCLGIGDFFSPPRLKDTKNLICTEKSFANLLIFNKYEK